MTSDQWGCQLKADDIAVKLPSESPALINLLVGAKIPGVGKAAATKLVNHFGDTVLDNIGDVTRLKQVKLSTKQITGLIHYAKAFNQSESLKILYAANLGPKALSALSAVEGLDTLLKNNPYELIGKVKRVGFKTIDSIALAQGIAVDSPFRIQAAILEFINQQLHAGHCYVL